MKHLWWRIRVVYLMENIYQYYGLGLYEQWKSSGNPVWLAYYKDGLSPKEAADDYDDWL